MPGHFDFRSTTIDGTLDGQVEKCLGKSWLNPIWWFQRFSWNVHPFGEMIQFDGPHIFQMGGSTTN